LPVLGKTRAVSLAFTLLVILGFVSFFAPLASLNGDGAVHQEKMWFVSRALLKGSPPEWSFVWLAAASSMNFMAPLLCTIRHSNGHFRTHVKMVDCAHHSGMLCSLGGAYPSDWNSDRLSVRRPGADSWRREYEGNQSGVDPGRRGSHLPPAISAPGSSDIECRDVLLAGHAAAISAATHRFSEGPMQTWRWNARFRSSNPTRPRAT
jgi:hypothetical protein